MNYFIYLLPLNKEILIFNQIWSIKPKQEVPLCHVVCHKKCQKQTTFQRIVCFFLIQMYFIH